MSLPKFLQKLLEITEEVPKDVAGWSLDGKEYIIHDARFETEYLPKYFKGSRATFIRQLHFYGFRKLDNVGEQWSFMHPKFIKGSPHLVYEIQRKTRGDEKGPASKDEVQALRDVVTNIGYKISRIETILEELKSRVFADNDTPDVVRGTKRPYEVVTHTAEESRRPKLANTRRISHTISMNSMDLDINDGFHELIMGNGTEASEGTDPTQLYEIFIRTLRGDIPVSAMTLADLLSRVVENSIALARSGKLGKPADPALVAYTHDHVGKTNPFRELLDNAVSDVYLVLLNVLTEYSGYAWLSQQPVNFVDPSEVEGSFVQRPFLMCASHDMVEISGGMFLVFLDYVVQTAATYDFNGPVPPERFNSRLFNAMVPFLSTRMFKVLMQARNNLWLDLKKANTPLPKLD